VPKKYIVDADVLISAKNHHYKFSFCDGFWQWLLKCHNHDLVFSIKKVKAQISAGKSDDELELWGNDNLKPSFYLEDSRDKAVIREYSRLVNLVKVQPSYKPQAINKFMEAKNAYAWLIAVAKHHNATVITGEVSAPESKANIKLPDAAKLLDVPTMSIYKLLAKHAEGTFKFKP
jgi:hypothetical protein